MDPTASVAVPLWIVGGEPDAEDDLAAALNQLGRDATRVVPSCLAVSVTVARLGGSVTLSAAVLGADQVPVLASLAVPLSRTDPGVVLTVQAGLPGAFDGVADQLMSLLGPGHAPPVLDGNLSVPPVFPGASLTGSLRELTAINQAIGVLIERGWAPERAAEELRRRGSDANTTLVAASRSLLLSLRTEPGSC